MVAGSRFPAAIYLAGRGSRNLPLGGRWRRRDGAPEYSGLLCCTSSGEFFFWRILLLADSTSGAESPSSRDSLDETLVVYES
jgi:hypothetical protein